MADDSKAPAPKVSKTQAARSASADAGAIAAQEAADAAAADASAKADAASKAGSKGGDANAEGQPGVANVVTANPTLGEDVTRAAENPTLPAASTPPPSKKDKAEALKADDRPQAQDVDPNNHPGTVEERAAAAPPREDWQ